MISYIIKRFLQIIPLLFVVSFIVFYMVRLIPGDPVVNMLGGEATEEAIEAARIKYGLDKPLPVQYVNFVKGAVRGDLGTSIFTKKSIGKEIAGRYVYTIKLAVGGVILASLVGVIFGVISAIKHNKFADSAIMVVSLLSVSTPSFFFALLLMLIFSLHFKLLPSVGIDTPWHYILPIVTLGMQSVGVIARTTRSSMLDVLSQDYVRTSKSRGIPNGVIIFSHALKNALIPVITVIGLRFGVLLAGATVVETVFSIPGIGRYVVDGVSKRDYPVVQGSVLVLSTTFVIVNLMVDLLYAVVDPRIKYD